MKFILGKKVSMSQIFDEKGIVIPVTVVQAGPVVVTALKNDTTKDGYNAVQVGFGSRKEKNINKAQRGHFKTLGNFMYLKEFRVDSSELKVGDKIDAGIFKAGDNVEVSSISKGKGFQGVVKRHGFRGGPRSHGQKHSEREPGSISGGVREGGRVQKKYAYGRPNGWRQNYYKKSKDCGSRCRKQPYFGQWRYSRTTRYFGRSKINIIRIWYQKYTTKKEKRQEV